MYFSDYGNHRVRRITVATGMITTHAGTGASSYSGDNSVGTSATLSHPNGLCIDSAGTHQYMLLIFISYINLFIDNLYIADFGNHRVRKITASTSVISTIAGTGSASYSGDNGPATSAALHNPIGVAVDTSGKDIQLPDVYFMTHFCF